MPCILCLAPQHQSSASGLTLRSCPLALPSRFLETLTKFKIIPLQAPHRRLPKAQTQARVLVALIMRKSTSRRLRWSSRLHMSLHARQRKTRTTGLGFSVWATWSPLAEQYQRRGWIVLKVHSESKRDDDVEGWSHQIAREKGPLVMPVEPERGRSRKRKRLTPAH